MTTARHTFTSRSHLALLLALLGGGLALRLWFLRWHPFIAGDSLLYQDIALNWLHSHVYGLSTDTTPRPTLIRLPGYPAILAALAWLTSPLMGDADPGTLRSFLPVLYLQIVADLGTCLLLASVAVRALGSRAGWIVLSIATFCPFLANYTVVPLTETFTIFFMALALWSLVLWIRTRARRWIVGLAVALACGVLLRPDQCLFAATMLLAVWHTRTDGKRSLRPVLLCVALIALPFLPWTLRNARTFHVFQPLAPRLANDPGETPPLGFQRWYRTWAVDFASTQDAYWKYPEETVRMDDLPARAWDGDEARAGVALLLQRATVKHGLDPAVEAEFKQLASERVRRAPFRYYLALPMARAVNMLLHPRTEMLPVDERWWQYRAHPAQTVFASLYGLLNLAMFAAGVAGFPRLLRAHRTVALSVAAYVLLRCVLLLTIDNAEQRYTMELIPIAILCAGGLAVRRSDAA